MNPNSIYNMNVDCVDMLQISLNLLAHEHWLNTEFSIVYNIYLLYLIRRWWAHKAYSSNSKNAHFKAFADDSPEKVLVWQRCPAPF